MMRFLLTIILLFLEINDNVFCAPIEPTKFSLKCGYEKCPQKYDESKINVHLIPHTHDDVGWLKTFEQYYYGNFPKVKPSEIPYPWGEEPVAGVQYILDSVVDELQLDTNKKFIYVETSFFWKWWKEQDDDTKNTVRKLVENGQLEFVGGGWSMNDEATTYYQQIIDNMSWGFRRLNDTFGECGVPKVAWQIDPFGHSKEQASIFAQMYFDGLFFTRLDYQERYTRMYNKTLEFVWKSNEDLGKGSDLFAGILETGNGYDSPTGNCWDLVNCGNDKINNPIIDDPESEEYNVKAKVNDFIEEVGIFLQYYSTNHILVPIGSDFHFQDAHSYFKNLDKLIYYVNMKQNEGSDFNVFYSTPSCYLQALHQANKTYQIKSDDFFPYGSSENSYWTGFYTSRPALKYYERRANNILQVCKQLNALTSIKMDEDSIVLKEALGVLQHHDAVSGTERQHVADDYARMLSKGIEKCKKVINEAYKKLLPKRSNAIIENQVFCENLNISACSITESGDQVAVTLYNPLGRQISQYIRLPVNGNSYQILNSLGEQTRFDSIPLPEFVTNIPGRKSNAINNLVFEATLPPIGFATYFLKPTNNGVDQIKTTKSTGSPFSLNGKSISVNFDSKGLLNSIKLADGKTVSIKQSFYYYKAMKGESEFSYNRASGAYVFRPDGEKPVDLGNQLNYSVNKGLVVQEVHQVFTPWASQTIRIYQNEDYVEFDWVLGPIPVDDKVGKEVITRFDTSLKTNGFFYTDSNGRQILERRRNWAPTHEVTVSEPESSNYYPINSRISINDQKEGLQLTLLNDRSQGGSSLEDGSVELMLHRRLLYDDAFGVSEALSEPGVDGKGLVVRGTTTLFLSKMIPSAKFQHDFNQRINLSPLMTFAKYKTENDYINDYNTINSLLSEALPENIKILTLEEWREGSLLLRLEHVYSSTDDPEGLSKSVTINLSKLFKPFKIQSALETTLGANQFRSKAKRLVFKYDPVSNNDVPFNEIKDLSITLAPMQIRTFIVSIN